MLDFEGVGETVAVGVEPVHFGGVDDGHFGAAEGAFGLIGEEECAAVAVGAADDLLGVDERALGGAEAGDVAESLVELLDVHLGVGEEDLEALELESEFCESGVVLVVAVVSDAFGDGVLESGDAVLEGGDGLTVLGEAVFGLGLLDGLAAMASEAGEVSAVPELGDVVVLVGGVDGEDFLRLAFLDALYPLLAADELPGVEVGGQVAGGLVDLALGDALLSGVLGLVDGEGDAPQAEHHDEQADDQDELFVMLIEDIH